METNSTYQLPIVYKQIVETDKHNIEAIGGRLGGKSTGTAILAVLCLINMPYTDIVCARVSYGSLADSSFSEFEAQLDKLPEQLRDEFTLKHSPLRIERNNGAGTVYFMGYGGSNTSRTKSFKPKHKISMVILEETQELKDRENLDQIKASLQRHFGEHVKFCILANPPAIKSHWFNVMTEENEKDPDWLVVHITYLDILPFINDFDLKDIIKTKYKRPEFYRWFYLGIPTGAFGSVYPMFDSEKHVITAQEFSFFLDKTGTNILACIIGGDGAVNRDETVFSPLLILSNGQSVVAQLFIHNPVQDIQMASHQLVKNYVSKWFNELCNNYHLGTIDEYRANPYRTGIKPIVFWIDCAATELVKACQYFFGDRASVNAYTKKPITQMVDTFQSVISNDMFYVIDYGGYKDYYLNKWVETPVNPLVEQMEALQWNDKNNGYKEGIPNDRTDSATYGVNGWYEQPENMQWLDIVNLRGINNILIRDIIKTRS